MMQPPLLADTPLAAPVAASPYIGTVSALAGLPPRLTFAWEAA